MNIFCIHKYKVEAMSNYRYTSEYSKKNMTRVLMKCTKCGNLKVKNIEGYWTMETNKEDE